MWATRKYIVGVKKWTMVLYYKISKFRSDAAGKPYARIYFRSPHGDIGAMESTDVTGNIERLVFPEIQLSTNYRKSIC